MSSETPPPGETRPSGEIPVDADLSGRQLRDYRLLRRLGRGGMADVYLAEQMSLKRQVAFKVLRSDLADNDTYVQRFHHEAQAAASLVHANIVQIYEVGEIDGVHFIAQEYVQGRNLKEYLDRHGTLDVRLAILIMRQVAAALYRAAQQGIVHRDIKPENVMIARTGEVKVADFGLARVLREGEQLNLTQVGVTMGTPLYMSPEQAEGKTLDHRSDLYSLGVTCYHMLTGEPPFRGETALSIAVQHVKSQAESLEKVRPDLPEGLCRIVQRLMAKDPAERYESARDLLRDLRLLPVEGLDEEGADDELWQALGLELAGPLEATRRLDDVMRTSAMVLSRRTRRLMWLTASIAAAALLGGAIVFFTRPPPLLEGADAAHVDIRRQETAQAQFVYAGLHDTKAHWLSVIHYEPPDPFYARLAKKELAMHYLEESDYEAASALFDELANVEAVEQELRAFGMAGQCVIDSLQDRHEQAITRLKQELRPLMKQVRVDRRMSRVLWYAIRKSYGATDRKREAWIDETFRSETEEDNPDVPGLATEKSAKEGTSKAKNSKEESSKAPGNGKKP